tara:strand:+ start:50 stop:289 length:240 start_codon:yes stop_codon:yes gene_type:complete
MKKAFIAFIIFFASQSCNQDHPMANRLCDCYSQLHRADGDNEVLFWTDSCNSLYIGILKNLEENLTEKKRFNKAYRRCQ